MLTLSFRKVAKMWPQIAALGIRTSRKTSYKSFCAQVAKAGVIRIIFSPRSSLKMPEQREVCAKKPKEARSELAAQNSCRYMLFLFVFLSRSISTDIDTRLVAYFLKFYISGIVAHFSTKSAVLT